MIRRLEPKDFGEREVGWLTEAAALSLDNADVGLYTSNIASGNLGVWSLWDQGIIGLTRTDKVLWVEFLVGEDLVPRRVEIVVWLKEMAGPRKVETLPSRQGMIRLLEQLGFKPVSTLMRLGDEHEST